MRILVQIAHPAHVHFYRHFITECESRGVETKVTVREKEIATELLDQFGIDYDLIFTIDNESPIGAIGQLKYELKTLKAVLSFDPDVITGIGGTAASHVGLLTGTESIIFTDSEGAPLANKITIPFADTICTPDGYGEDYGENHIRYDGYHELAYLHPDRFEAKPNALRDYGVDPNERYFVVRFISWGAQHDVGHHGLSIGQKRTLVSELADHGTVYITSEGELPGDLEGYQLPVPPHMIHSLLASADMYVGDSQTMATEAALLGTPSIRSNSFAGEDDMSNFVELEEGYGLLFSTPDGQEAIKKAKTWVRESNLQSKWEDRREKLLEEKIDVTDFLIDVMLEREL